MLLWNFYHHHQLEDLCNDANLKPSAMDLALTFIDQCTQPTNSKTYQMDDRTKRYISVVIKIAYKSCFTLEQIEQNFPIAFQKYIIIGILSRIRKSSGLEGIIRKEKKEGSEEIVVSASYAEIIYHRWILRAISKRSPTWFVKTPALEGTESHDLVQLGDESISALNDLVNTVTQTPNILDNIVDKPFSVNGFDLEKSILFDIANYYFFREDYENSFKTLKNLYPKFKQDLNESMITETEDRRVDPLKENCTTLIIACQSVLASKHSIPLLFNEHKKTLIFRQIDETVRVLNDSAPTPIGTQNTQSSFSVSLGSTSLDNFTENELSDKLVRLLLDDNIDNQLSREYRVTLCYKLIGKDMVFKKILACNIIQDMIKIIQGHSIYSIQQELEAVTQDTPSSSYSTSSVYAIPEESNDFDLSSVQTHLDRYVLKHKFVTSQPLLSVYIILFLKQLEEQASQKENKETEEEEEEEKDANLENLEYESSHTCFEYDHNFKSTISDFVCRLAKYVNHPVVYATLLSEGADFIACKENNSNQMNDEIHPLVAEYEKLILDCVEKVYHLNFFNATSTLPLEEQEPNFRLLPKNVQQTLLRACTQKKKENDSYYEHLYTIGSAKKRPYSQSIQNQHLLFLDDVESISSESSPNVDALKRLKIDSTEYLSLRARDLIYRSSYGNALAFEKSSKLFDVASQVGQFRDKSMEKKVAFDRLLLSLSKKALPPYIPEEYPLPRIESKQIERPSPVIENMEQFVTLCKLCKLSENPSESAQEVRTDGKEIADLSLSFLGELFKNLIDLEDWAFTRDFFKQILSIYEHNSKNDEDSPYVAFCRFVIVVESLAYHMKAPRTGAPKKVFKDLKDDTYRFIHNLIYLPNDHQMGDDQYNLVEDENRLRWDDFHQLVTSQNLKFLMDMAVMLTFVLVSLRMTVGSNVRSNSPSTITVQRGQLSGFLGHYKHLSKLIMPDYFCSSTKKNWLVGNEKFVEDTLVIMLQHILERVITLQEQSQQKQISTFYLFKICLADLYFEKGKFRKALELYLECGEANFPQFYKPTNEEVIERMVRCLMELGEYTASAVLHQFIHSTYDNELDSQSRAHLLGENSFASNSRVGYTKEVIDSLYETSGLNERWLLYFYDLSYLELVVHIAHQKGEYNKEELMIQHIQRSEMNNNNKTEHRKEYILQMKENFLRKLYLHVTTFLKNK